MKILATKEVRVECRYLAMSNIRVQRVTCLKLCSWVRKRGLQGWYSRCGPVRYLQEYATAATEIANIEIPDIICLYLRCWGYECLIHSKFLMHMFLSMSMQVCGLGDAPSISFNPTALSAI